MKYELLSDKIHVYKNLIKDPNAIVKVLKESEQSPEKSYFFKDWQDWFIFGKYVVFVGKGMPRINSTNKPDKYLEEKKYVEEIEKCFYESTDHFLQHYNIKKEDGWTRMGPSYAKYFYDNKLFEEHREYAMTFHTDYQEENDINGQNFALTCTMYLNDDYEGGELLFKVGEEIIKYKPESGDVLVFPSGHPDFMSEEFRYEHAVTKVSKKEKYFIRCFYKV
jgi:hypothetical protein